MTALATTWLRFNAVGLLGIGVQLAALQFYRNHLGWNYLLATAMAVETAVLHNYVWHCKWTWRERQADSSSLLRFQFTTGLVSIFGNLFAMRILTGMVGLPVLPASLVSITALYMFNFLVSDRYVFRLR